MSHLVLALALSFAPQGANCSGTSVGLTPLADLAGAYLGKPGGLYPGGVDAMPSAHLVAGLLEAAQIVPRDAAGAPSGAGKIGLVTIGMSNTNQESSAFLPLANASPLKSPSVVLVNGAQGGQDAVAISSPSAPYWTYVDQRVAAAGLTNAQVQAAWLKEAIAGISLPFPQDSDLLEAYLRTIVQILRSRFPNLRACYLSSRIYAGYATTRLNPEPYAYQSAFAVRELIESQIAGAADLNFAPAAGPVLAPWLAWGPYLWADGLVPRSDGLVWTCADFQSDGTHPSASGAQKVAQMLLAFFTTDPTASPWFRGACGAAAGAALFGSGLAGASGVPQLQPASPPELGSALTLHASGAPALSTTWFAVGTVAYPDGVVPFAGGWVHESTEIVAPVVCDGLGHAQVSLGTIPALSVLCGVHLYAQVATTDAAAPQGFGLSRGLDLRLGG